MTVRLKKTADGFEISTSFMRLLVTGVTLIGGTWAGAQLLVRKSDAIDLAVSRREFIDTSRAIRGDLANVMARVDTTSTQLLRMNCAQNGYPSPFCDRVPRPASIRGRTP